MIIKDIQGQKDLRNIAIEKVGITNVGYQGTIVFGSDRVSVFGKCNCYASLSAEKRGTHMSRMARVIQKMIGNELSISNISESLKELNNLLDNENIFLNFKIQGLRKKCTPISKLDCFEPFDLIIEGSIYENQIQINGKIIITATSLCPASKENSILGAHNQRSVITVETPLCEESNLIVYMELLENCASAPVYPILKLEDESYVTELAYKNPGFVEDIVRNCVIAMEQNNLPYKFISCENFESIHTHNAFACITK